MIHIGARLRFERPNFMNFINDGHEATAMAELHRARIANHPRRPLSMRVPTCTDMVLVVITPRPQSIEPAACFFCFCFWSTLEPQHASSQLPSR